MLSYQTTLLSPNRQENNRIQKAYPLSLDESSPIYHDTLMSTCRTRSLPFNQGPS